LVLLGIAIAVSDVSNSNLLVAMCCGVVLMYRPLQLSPRIESKPQPTVEEVVTFVSTQNFRLYRQQELNRIIASLLSNNSILVVGEEGSGKSTLAVAVVEKLEQDGFVVINCEPTTPKQMLKEIAEHLGVDTYSIDGKALTTDKLKRAIAIYLENNTVFLIIDDAHNCEPKFRGWLKYLRRQNVPMLLLATRPPKSDVFINIPRIELAPLPEYAIRELMERTALDKGINLKTHDLARLQERAGGNPMLAKRSIDEEFLGLDVEAGDHTRYFDMSPAILLVGCAFIVMRFVALGTNNAALYVMTGATGALFAGASYAMRALPKEDKRRI
jgi:hypothetical protein